MTLPAVAGAEPKEEPGDDDAPSRVERWIDRTLETLDAAHQPHVDLRAGPLHEPRTRATTGTSWLPDATPSYALIFPVRRWGMIVRGNVFAGYGWGSGPRGAQDALNTNSLLLSALGNIRNAELVVRSVLSWEAYTVPQGLPAPLHRGGTGPEDRQRPRRLFHELATQLTIPSSSGVAVQLYTAVRGAPALGLADPAFRASGFFDPVLPIGVAVLESTHAVPGVVTLGLLTRQAKLEGSWFASPERDSPKHGLVAPTPDAGSVRLQTLPNREWVLGASYAHLHDDWLQRQVDRWLATAAWSKGTEDSNKSVSLLAGVSRAGARQLEPGSLMELTWTRLGHHTLYGRLEALRYARSRWLEEASGFAAVASLTTGYAYAFRPLAALAPSLGVRGQLVTVSRSLQSAYGSRVVGGFSVYAQLRQASLPRVTPSPTAGDD